MKCPTCNAQMMHTLTSGPESGEETSLCQECGHKQTRQWIAGSMPRPVVRRKPTLNDVALAARGFGFFTVRDEVWGMSYVEQWLEQVESEIGDQVEQCFEQGAKRVGVLVFYDRERE